MGGGLVPAIPPHEGFDLLRPARYDGSAMAPWRSTLTAAVLALLAAALAGCSAAPYPADAGESHDPSDQIPLRVMTFNLLNGKHDLHVARWDKRKQLAADCIKAADPDLLGMQEVLEFQADYLRKQLPGYGFVGTGRADGKHAGEYVAIFFKSDRFEKLDEGHFWLSKTPDVPGSKDWLSAVPRIVTWVKLRTREEPVRTFYHFNTHFDPVSKWAQIESAGLLRRRVAEIAGSSPVIVTGDFNANAGNETHKTLLGEEGSEGLTLIDGFRAAHPQRQGNEGTYRLPGNVRVPRRIDWILHTPHFRTVGAAVDLTNDAGRFPSDHYPVVANLSLDAARAE